MLPCLPQIGAQKGEVVRQAVFLDGLLRQSDGRRLNIHTGDLKRTLPLKQQQRQKPGAAAKVTDPEAGAQPRQGGEQKGVRTGAEQTVLPDEAECPDSQGHLNKPVIFPVPVSALDKAY